MRVAVSGAGGLIGSALMKALSDGGHDAVRLVRRVPSAGETAVRWDPASGVADRAGLEKFDAVVHLAGENIAAGRWNAARKAAIRGSRVAGTRLLGETLASLASPPATLVCASAIGYYGDRGEELVTEDSSPGSGFLAEVCKEWEAAAAPAADRGIRVVTLRIGMVLAPHGGALSRMLPLFRAGFRGVLGSGRQYVSWICLEDIPPIVLHALSREDLKGPVNAVAPRPVTQRELAQALGRALSRPALLPVPAFALRLALGEMADALLLSGCRAAPRKLEETGYRFRYPELGGALRRVVESSSSR
ncbi:MAG: TIGR01777 family oxidoreductase [Verrucomicrobiota bacterium]